MKNSLMYRLCYYRFGEVHTSHREPPGYDSVRRCEIGLKKWDLKYYREAYTSSRWLVRIFEVLPMTNRDTKMTSRALKGNTSIYKKAKAKSSEPKDSSTKGDFGIMGKRPTI